MCTPPATAAGTPDSRQPGTTSARSSRSAPRRATRRSDRMHRSPCRSRPPTWRGRQIWRGRATMKQGATGRGPAGPPRPPPMSQRPGVPATSRGIRRSRQGAPVGDQIRICRRLTRSSGADRVQRRLPRRAGREHPARRRARSAGTAGAADRRVRGCHAGEAVCSCATRGDDEARLRPLHDVRSPSLRRSPASP
jgi:hypothetical protein